MKISKYRINKAIIGGGLGAAVGIAIATDTAIIAVAAVFIAIVAALILERRNKEIVRDERLLQISWRSAHASFSTMLVLAALATLIIALFRDRLPENVVFFGTLMGYFICAAVLLHFGFYIYFSRKQ